MPPQRDDLQFDNRTSVSILCGSHPPSGARRDSLLLSISVLLLSLSPSSFAIASHRPSFLSAHIAPPLCPPPRALLSSRLPSAVGPALVKQDQDEAVANVSKRLEWIESELDKVGSKEKEITKGLETQSRKVQKMQAEAQAAATAPAE